MQNFYIHFYGIQVNGYDQLIRNALNDSIYPDYAAWVNTIQWKDYTFHINGTTNYTGPYDYRFSYSSAAANLYRLVNLSSAYNKLCCKIIIMPLPNWTTSEIILFTVTALTACGLIVFILWLLIGCNTNKRTNRINNSVSDSIEMSYINVRAH